jgi:hypothetical protein
MKLVSTVCFTHLDQGSDIFSKFSLPKSMKHAVDKNDLVVSLFPAGLKIRPLEARLLCLRIIFLKLRPKFLDGSLEIKLYLS